MVVLCERVPNRTNARAAGGREPAVGKQRQRYQNRGVATAGAAEEQRKQDTQEWKEGTFETRGRPGSGGALWVTNHQARSTAFSPYWNLRKWEGRLLGRSVHRLYFIVFRRAEALEPAGIIFLRSKGKRGPSGRAGGPVRFRKRAWRWTPIQGKAKPFDAVSRRQPARGRPWCTRAPLRVMTYRDGCSFMRGRMATGIGRGWFGGVIP